MTTLSAIAALLDGPKEPRHAHARHPMTEAECRDVLTCLDAQMPRKRRASAARFFADSKVGNLTHEARALYRAYAAIYEAAAK